jgi:thiamine-phosphate pyrophosphorylase
MNSNNLKYPDFKIYLITDRNRCKNENLLPAVHEALKGGIRCIQLREKDMSTTDLLKLAIDLRVLTRKYSAYLIINDRIDICLSVDADGIHLPETGLPISVARKLIGNEKLIGISLHSFEDIKNKSNLDFDFFTLSPIFETTSKPGFKNTLGSKIIYEAKRLTNKPLFALGGINDSNIDEVIENGADGIALISGILSKENISKAAASLIKKFPT